MRITNMVIVKETKTTSERIQEAIDNLRRDRYIQKMWNRVNRLPH